MKIIRLIGICFLPECLFELLAVTCIVIRDGLPSKICRSLPFETVLIPGFSTPPIK